MGERVGSAYGAHMDDFLDFFATTALAMFSVGLWTVRVAVTARGRRIAGASVAAIEATVFAAAFSRLLADLDSPVRIAAYAVGVAAGTLLGLHIDERFGRRGQYEAGGSLAGNDSLPHSSTTSSDRSGIAA